MCADERKTPGALLFSLSPLRQGLSLNLKLNYQPARPSSPPITAAHNAEVTGVQCSTWFSTWVGSSGLHSKPLNYLSRLSSL